MKKLSFLIVFGLKFNYFLLSILKHTIQRFPIYGKRFFYNLESLAIKIRMLNEFFVNKNYYL